MSKNIFDSGPGFSVRHEQNLVKSLILGAILCLLPLSAPYAATLKIVDGQLVGASSVLVSGSLYDVKFQDGTCVELYDGCDEESDFIFSNSFEGMAASQALLDLVLIDTGANSFDSNPELTAGCLDPNCAIHTPYGVFTTLVFPDFGEAFEVTFALTALADNVCSDITNIFCILEPGVVGAGEPVLASDSVSTRQIGNQVDLSSERQRTYAVWTPAAIPVPATIWLFGSALLGLTGYSRLKGNRGA